MAKIAVDVVLLPPEEVAVRAIEANRELQKQCPGRIILNRETCLPHISLAMGCINDSDVARIEVILRKLAGKHRPGALISVGINVGTNAAGEKVSALELEKTESLQKLHESVMLGFAPYFNHEVTAEMLISPPEISESTLCWIRDFPEKSSFQRFFPHITLGYGQLADFPFPPEFIARRLALCHLANHCTCRNILASAEFPP